MKWLALINSGAACASAIQISRGSFMATKALSPVKAWRQAEDDDWMPAAVAQRRNDEATNADAEQDHDERQGVRVHRTGNHQGQVARPQNLAGHADEPGQKEQGQQDGYSQHPARVCRLVFFGLLGKRSGVRLPTDQQHGDATQNIEARPQVDGRGEPQDRQGHKAGQSRPSGSPQRIDAVEATRGKSEAAVSADGRLSEQGDRRPHQNRGREDHGCH